jgi:hypothetical protein
VPNGTYSVVSQATNAAGSTFSAGITITVNNLHTAILMPAAGATVSGASVTLDASAAGPTTVTGVSFVVSGGSLSNQVVGTATATIYGWVAHWNTTAVPNGTYLLQSVATQTGGTTATSPAITVVVAN